MRLKDKVVFTGGVLMVIPFLGLTGWLVWICLSCLFEYSFVDGIATITFFIGLLLFMIGGGKWEAR